jgi:hypothetical protein
LIAVVNLTSGKDRNLHRREETRSARTRESSMVTAPIFIGPLIACPARAALMIEDCESIALLTPGIDSKRLRCVESDDLRVAIPGLARIQREQKDVFASVSQLDGVQVAECPHKQTGGGQDEKRDRELGYHQHVLRAAARSAPALIL